MLQQASLARLDKVAGVVGGILAKHRAGDLVTHDAELSRLGMTSVDMVELMLAVEAEFDVMIPPHEITTDNFRSIASIDRLVGRL